MEWRISVFMKVKMALWKVKTWIICKVFGKEETDKTVWYLVNTEENNENHKRGRGTF